jgi:NAD(P)H-flavin reductase
MPPGGLKRKNCLSLPDEISHRHESFEKTSKIYIAGHRGMVGSAIMRRLEQGGYTSLITRTAEITCNRLHAGA